MRWRGRLALVSWMLACAPGALAQQSIDYASISGRVTDQSGAVIEGAEVVVRQMATNLTRRALTDRDGRYRFPYLRIGPYEVSIAHAGFRDATRRLTLAAGAAFELPVTLEVRGIEARVSVVADATVLDAARSQIAGTIPQAAIESLPLDGRNVLDLALLVPGVSPANTTSTQLFPETSAVPGVSLSIGSQRNLSNNFVVDGLSANDDAAGLSGMTYGLDAVEQFQVVTSGGQAALGRALGGYINVVTKSGTNDLHGSAYEYVRDDRLNARNALSGTKLPMSQHQYGASAGGPIVADRSFYFANVEQRRLDQTGLVTIAPSDVSVVNARLARTGYQGPPVTTGEYGNPLDTTNVLAKVDHHVSGRDQLSVRYSLYSASSRNSRGAGALDAPSASSGLENLDQALAFSNTLTLSDRTVLETRAQVASADLKAPPTDPIGPAVTIAGVADFGTSSGSPTRRLNRLYQLTSDVSHQAGAHALKAGVDVLYNDDRITYPRSVRGSYTFSSLAAFLHGTYDNSGFTQTFGASDVSQTNPNVGLYAQDEWKVGPDVTLNLGIRYDLQFLETIHTDTDNISPRLGIAWSPFDSRRTIVRGSAGLFYDRVPLRPVANALLSAGNTPDVTNLRQIRVNLSPGQAGAPAFPAILDGVVPSLTLPSLTTMDRNLQNAYSRQVSAEIEQQLGNGSIVSIGYEYLRGKHLLMSINQNVPACVASGTNNGCRPNPGYANDNQYSSAGDSNSHALHVSFVQRPAEWGSYRVAYTFSNSMNNVGEFFFSSPIDPFDLSKDWGRSDDDRRHRLVIAGTLRSPSGPATSVWQQLTDGFEVSGVLRAYSALPFNITSGVTTIQGTVGRPVVGGQFIGRNTGSGSSFATLSARVARRFHLVGRADLELMVEGFNLTNRRNVLTRNTNFGRGAYPAEPLPAFGRATAVGDPRSFQVAARVRF